jgi:hypothetical protein
MVAQQVVDEPIAATDPLQKHALGGVVKEMGIMPRDHAIAPQYKAQCEMLNASGTWHQRSE